MSKVSIKAPVNSLESARIQIKAGAGEIYLGYLSERIKKLSFSGRGKESYNKTTTHVVYEEFKAIIELAHSNGVKVEFAANMPMIGDDPDGGTKFQDYYLEYVQKGIDAGVDRIIVGDIGNILFLRQRGITAPITGSVFLATMNVSQIKFLEELGVDKVVLPHHVTFEEIRELKRNTSAEIEIFAHFGCSFIESTCSMYHHANEDINFGVPCRAIYEIAATGENTGILDTGEDCSLCVLPQVMEAGVSSIKIIGRELDYKLTSTITYIYSYAISMLEKGQGIQEILHDIKSKYDFEFWEKSFCDTNRCKYVNTQYYV